MPATFCLTPRPRLTRFATLAAGILAGASVLAAPVSATRAIPGDATIPEGYVIAQSDFGSETVRGSVRFHHNRLQVQLPGGTWVDCAQSCSETLRLETVDFWYSDKGRGQNGATTHGPGLFGRLQLNFGW
ncbi:MAG: hypothetical protein ACFCUN_05360 [Hyphomicrobiaceae bacterium]